MSSQPPSSTAIGLEWILPWLQVAAFVSYLAAQALLVVYSSHRYVTLWRWWRNRRSRHRRAPLPPESWPAVTVQLPFFNERLVVERLIEAVGRLDYPVQRLQVQVLDDSTDETTDRAAAAVERLRARGVRIELHHRVHREGYKAGALAAGLRSAQGDLIVVFDADFLPAPDFLKRIVPHFADPRVGMVQARWGHLNRNRSLLTAAQAVMLDSHFFLEHDVRMSGGLFFNFNGTAGAWRKSCIESSGGWMHDTLTEDLDLSYRAQLCGWRFVFDPSIVSPAELPTDMEALKSQQRRWAKGSIQTARKLLPRVFSSPLPLRVKVEAFFHLTSNLAYPLLLMLGLLLLPVMVAHSTTHPLVVAVLYFGVVAMSVVPVSLFLGVGRVAGLGGGWGTVREVGAALLLGAGLSVNNTRAVLEGLGAKVGDWERTPKTGDGRRPPRLRPYSPARALTGRTELLLAAYFTALAILAWTDGDRRALPFILLMLVGFGYVALGSFTSSAGGRASLAGARRPDVLGRRPGAF